ncbi:MAG: hypothetical protein LBU11_06730 [Zoogloeaceae bacterium]|jgi:hypothetical protein|nr:hypothetical protein [Zoogloeaceae bacterium]
MANHDATLTGDDLLQFLDRLEADLEEGGSSEAVDLRARLKAQPLRADTLEAVARLHSLWMRAGDAAAARAVIEKDGEALLQILPPEARVQTKAHLLRFQLQIAEYLAEVPAMQEALVALRLLVDEPGFDAAGTAELDVFARLCGGAHLGLALKAAEFQHALNRAIPERSAYRAWDEAVFRGRIANSRARHGNTAEAAAAARQAIAALKTAADDQDVDADDWLRLGNALIDIAPECLPEFQSAITALIEDWPLPRRREMEVRLARLRARANYAQGDLAGALAACEDARYSLNPRGTGGDDFIEYELPWLLEAGKIEEAGKRAFLAVYDVEWFEDDQQELPESVYRIVHERLADPADASVWWPLCALCACRSSSNRAMRELLAAAPKEAAPIQRALFGDFWDTDPDAIDEKTDLDPVFQAARELAEKRAEKHAPDALARVWIRRLAAAQDFEAGRIDAPAYLREIEAVVASGLNDKRTIHMLYLARFHALGVMETLKFPLPVFACGIWAYRGAGDIPEDIQEKAGGNIGESEQKAIDKWAADFKRAVYEQGRACMERYFETGKGHPFDASAHLYSMLCCNLAVYYRYDNRSEEALELHRRGIEASSFAEHYDGIFVSHTRLQDNANIVKAAEDLWHYVAEYGYSRFDPEEIARFCAEALYHLERARDIPIWLERLTQWERQNDIAEDNLPEDHLYARIVILFYMCVIDDYKETALDMWRRIEAQVRKSETGKLDGFAGDFMRALERWEDALFFYERVDTRGGLSEKGKELKARCLANLAGQKKEEKRWWQVWK